MDKPTAEAIRAWSPPDMDWSGVGFPAPADPADDAALQKRVDWSIGYVENTTGRPLATITPPTTAALDVVDLTLIAEQAVLLATVQRILQGSRKYLKATVLQDYITSFTAGSYSETRRAADEIVRGRGGFVSNPPVNPWPALSDLLWLLMTDARVLYWRQRLTGVTPPAGAFIGEDWRSTWGTGGDGPPMAWGAGIANWP